MLRVRSVRSPVRCGVVISICVTGAACRPADPALQIAVDDRLSRDQVTAPLSIDISVTRGVIHLAGEVTSRHQQRHIVELARSVDGVKDVVDEMHLSDAAIVAAVRRALSDDPLVGKIPIDVTSNRGTVSLMSDQTDKDQRARAREISTTVDGVKQVEDLMR